MDRVEFYEKYFRMPDGSKPPPLTEMDRQLFELYDMAEKGVISDIRIFRTRNCKVGFMVKVNEDYKKLGDFLKQPKQIDNGTRV